MTWDDNPSITHPRFNAWLVDEAKDLSGKWFSERKRWIFPKMAAPEVAKLNQRFNTNPIIIEIVAKRRLEVTTDPVTCLGYTIARAFGRDGGAKLGDQVMLLKGGQTSGGSRANWKTIVYEGSRYRLEVPAALITDWHIETDDWELILPPDNTPAPDSTDIPLLISTSDQ